MSSASPGWDLAVGFAEQAIARHAGLGLRPIGAGAELLSQRSLFTDSWTRRQVSMGGHCRLLRTADGWCAVHLPRRDDVELLPAWLGVHDSADEVAWEELTEVLSLRPTSEVVRSGQELGLAISALPNGEDEQLRDRGTTNPARPWIQRRVGTRRSDASLDGARVVDLSSLWAGPLCSRILTEAGAKVVKVESSTRPDASRDGDRALFDWLHAGQEFLSIPLEEPSGVDELAALLEQADVVIEGSRPRALDRLGIVPAEIVAKRSGTVWLSITAYGRCGPWRDWVGFGDDAAVAGGLVDLDASGVPSFVGDAVADPLTGLLAAAIVADAFGRGGGVTIDVALREVARSAATGARVVW
ncbi:unannotated protein [freshwater metagenome]|uniref:Unannotated protein n=1 Tax=freshwater metagenome TaxID=449393 RepID=A0A6J6HWI0_9ZZZZ|nr:hypothetical protein [Actinomycetota bacterium]